jgi:hypothetical protein
MYYDRQGKPLSMMQWAKLHSNPGYKRIAQHE